MPVSSISPTTPLQTFTQAQVQPQAQAQGKAQVAAVAQAARPPRRCFRPRARVAIITAATTMPSGVQKLEPCRSAFRRRHIDVQP